VISKPKLTIERTFQASIEEVWELWTTKDGIESWWGPEGFSVTVRSLDLRPGGDLLYAMSAVRAEEIEYMVKAGMPVSNNHRIKFVEVDPPRRLVFKEVVDFVPDTAAYDVETMVELHQVDASTRLLITFEQMHNERWTELARMGRESELDRLAKVLAARQ
jgi:uncharacterized protein YndB with AHSA1/START domain